VLQTLDRVQRELELEGELTLPLVLHVAGSLSNDQEPTQLVHFWPTVERLINQAIGEMVRMRKAEGRQLARSLRNHINQVSRMVKEMRRYCRQLVSDYAQRLSQRVSFLTKHLGHALAPQDLIKEVCIYAERCDITEELDRLASHLKQLKNTLPSTEPVGKKLDFLAQEMIREANTIAAKSTTVKLSQQVIELKTSIEKIREQVQNIE
jgi:uncharacterized protein (TIGR00255 family)